MDILDLCIPQSSGNYNLFCLCTFLLRFGLTFTWKCCFRWLEMETFEDGLQSGVFLKRHHPSSLCKRASQSCQHKNADGTLLLLCVTLSFMHRMTTITVTTIPCCLCCWVLLFHHFHVNSDRFHLSRKATFFLKTQWELHCWVKRCSVNQA